MSTYPHLAYEDWSEDPRERELLFQHAFGMHIFENVRDPVLADLPGDLATKDRELIQAAVDATIDRFLALLDNICPTSVGPNAQAWYRLSSEICLEDAPTGETFNIVPEGDGLNMGFAGWLENDFGQSRPKRRRSTKA
jgi:hypothetical protein